LIGYIDASVLLRIVLQQPEPLEEWLDLHEAISSKLLRVECYRAIDRIWQLGLVTQRQLEMKTAVLETFLKRTELQDLDNEVLRVAAHPLPSHLTTLDALHLATAIVRRRTLPADAGRFVFATHDRALAKTARELHFEVIDA
jgi:predicted nucleic acid-binding protein